MFFKYFIIKNQKIIHLLLYKQIAFCYNCIPRKFLKCSDAQFIFYIQINNTSNVGTLKWNMGSSLGEVHPVNTLIIPL